MQSLDRCPVCNSDCIRFHYKSTTTNRSDKQEWTVYHCDQCSHGFINPQPSWEELSPYYSANYKPYTASHGAGDSDEKIVAQAKEQGEFRHIKISEGDRILDVGCGGGYFLRIASKLGAVVQGVEPSPIGAETASQSGLEVFNGTVSDFASNHAGPKFDIITANHVVEHTPDPVETLTAMKELLAPDGYIWIAVPNADCWFSRRMKGRWHGCDLPYHIMQFSAKSMAEAGRRAGLNVKRQYMTSLPSAVAYSVRQFLRAYLFIPMRILLPIGMIESLIAPRVADRLDKKRLGEAIVTEFRCSTGSS